MRRSKRHTVEVEIWRSSDVILGELSVGGVFIEHPFGNPTNKTGADTSRFLNTLGSATSSSEIGRWAVGPPFAIMSSCHDRGMIAISTDLSGCPCHWGANISLFRKKGLPRIGWPSGDCSVKNMCAVSVPSTTCLFDTRNSCRPGGEAASQNTKLVPAPVLPSGNLVSILTDV